MRAFVYDRYGGIEQLRLEDVPVPVPANGEVLVEVHAVSINLSDWEGLTGKPAYARFTGGLFRPRRRTLGSDIAGRVAAIGSDVTEFAVGDEVKVTGTSIRPAAASRRRVLIIASAPPSMAGMSRAWKSTTRSADVSRSMVRIAGSPLPDGYSTPSSSTSNTSVALGGITPPAPRAP